MLVMSLSGAVIAVGREGAAMNIPAGLTTAYLVITALLTVQPPSSRLAEMERGDVRRVRARAGCLASALVSAGRGQMGFVYPVVMFGSWPFRRAWAIAGCSAPAACRGARGSGRHLWRMCAALFIAAGSFFLGPVRRIPEPLRIAPLRFIPLLVLVTMVYWLWRYRRNRMSSRGGAAAAI